MKIIAFPSVSRGAGQSSLIFHLAWMYADLGTPVAVVDFDPQARLTSKFLDTGQLDALWSGSKATRKTVYGSLRPLLDGSGEARSPHMVEVSPGIELLPGDPALAETEAELARRWMQRLSSEAPALRTLEGVRTIMERATTDTAARLVLLDVGPNFGALNRFALMAADHAVLPLATDVGSFHGLRNFGPTLWAWRNEWQEFVDNGSAAGSEASRLPPAGAQLAGYVVLDRAFLLNRHFDSPDRWALRLASEYASAMQREPETAEQAVSEYSPPLARLKHYPGLLSMAQDVRKPVFLLTSGDGVIGSEVDAVQDCYVEFRDAARKIADSCGVALD